MELVALPQQAALAATPQPVRPQVPRANPSVVSIFFKYKNLLFFFLFEIK
jgi:hypothetical protein